MRKLGCLALCFPASLTLSRVLRVTQISKWSDRLRRSSVSAEEEETFQCMLKAARGNHPLSTLCGKNSLQQSAVSHYISPWVCVGVFEARGCLGAAPFSAQTA